MNTSNEESDDENKYARSESTDKQDRVSNRWVPDTAVLDTELPRELQSKLGRVLGKEPVETLDNWVTAVRQQTGGGAIAIEDLCHSEAETPHWGKLDGDRYYFRCFYDAVILAAFADQPVDIRTESPGGAVITARAAGTTELTVTPDDAVFSFGIDETVDPPSGRDPSPGDIYSAVCPYVKALPGQDAYKSWAPSVPAVTIAMPLAGATEVATALVE